MPHVCPLESVYDVARLSFFERYVPLHPWTLFNASIHRPPEGSRPFDMATDRITVQVGWLMSCSLDVHTELPG